MTDFEGRVRDALVAASHDAPGADRLAESAHRRARGRRRRSVAVVAAVAVVAVAVPVAVVVGSGGDGGRTATDANPEPTGAPAPPVGWRGESWRDMEIDVPDAWGYGSMTAWCASGGSPQPPEVDRQEGAIPMIACPYVGYGAQFYDPAAATGAAATLDTEPGDVQQAGGDSGFPEGAWAGHATTENAGVLVVAPTEDEARTVLGSVHQVDVADRNGCPKGVYASTDFRLDADPGGRLTVCRYAGNEGRDEPSHWLAQSTQLTGAQSAEVRALIAAAPVGTVPYRRCDGQSEFYLLTTGDGVPAWIYNAECLDHGVLTQEGETLVERLPTEKLLGLLGSPYGLLRR